MNPKLYLKYQIHPFKGHTYETKVEVNDYDHALKLTKELFLNKEGRFYLRDYWWLVDEKNTLIKNIEDYVDFNVQPNMAAKALKDGKSIITVWAYKSDELFWFKITELNPSRQYITKKTLQELTEYLEEKIEDNIFLGYCLRP